MKHGKRPTVRQKKMMETARINPDNWLVSKDTPKEIVLVHRHTDTVRVIEK